MTLYEFTGAAKDLYALLENDEIDEQTFHDTLEAIGAEDKVESYCQIISQLEADKAELVDAKIAVLQGEIDRLKSAGASITNKTAI